MKKFYVYVIFRSDGTPCYVGKGQRDRWQAHFRERDCRNKHLWRIIAKAGGTLPIVKLRCGLTDMDACAIERAFIAAIGRGKDGPLVNMTDGGEGSAGLIPSRETLEKLSRIRKGWNPSAETREKMGRGRRGKKTSEEAKQKQRLAKIGRPLTEEHKRNISLATRGKPRGPLSELHRQSLRAGWVKRAARAVQVPQ